MEGSYLDQKGWPEIRLTNTRSRVPWGYQRSPEDRFLLLPDPDLILFAEKAMDYLDQGNSLRETSAWLAAQTGIEISHQTLSNMWKRNRGKEQNERSAALKVRKKANKPKTKAEREALTHTRKLAAAKRTLTMLTKKEEAGIGLPAKAPHNVQEEHEEISARDVPDTPVAPAGDATKRQSKPPDKNEVLFRPNPGPQYEFLAATEKEVLYGGAAGGEV